MAVEKRVAVENGTAPLGPLVERYPGDEKAIRREITLGYNNCGTRFTCGVCGRFGCVARDKQLIGLEFRTIDGNPVYEHCGRKYADDTLVAIYDFFWRALYGDVPRRPGDTEVPF